MAETVSNAQLVHEAVVEGRHPLHAQAWVASIALAIMASPVVVAFLEWATS